MSDLVQADYSNELNGDILKFCLAKMKKEEIETQTAPEKKKRREQIKTYTNILADRMKESNTNIIYIQPDENTSESWIVLKPIISNPKKLTAATVVDVIKNINIGDLEQLNNQHLTEVLKEYLINKLSRQDTGKYTIAMQTKKPRIAKNVDLTHQNPELLEIAKDFTDSKQSSKQLSKQYKEIILNETKICESTTPSIEQYIKNVSPAIPIAPVQIEINGEQNKFYVRSRETSKTKNITLKILIPICGEVIREELQKSGHGDEVTENTLTKLQMPSCMNTILEKIQSRITQYKKENSEINTKITLERGLPRKIETI